LIFIVIFIPCLSHYSSHIDTLLIQRVTFVA
jgi:hypothetical protein